MLNINNLSFYFGSRPLYEDVSWHIKPKERIGLIGPNGAGKSTLLKLITGEYTPDSGSITKSNDCSIGFLNQDLLSYQTDDSILQVALEAFEKENELQKNIDRTIKLLETDYSDKLVERLTRYQEEFDALGGYTIQARAEEILEGLGFTTSQLTRPLREFSGGWRMRVILAKMLLQKPSLLMMDEPTNHLDLPAIEWLETYLNNYDGATVVVSHDKQFLDNVCKTIAEVSYSSIDLYTGNYSAYIEEKALRNEIQQNAFKNQQQQIKQTEQFINRFKAKASKARQVQSKVKALERLDKVDDVRSDNAAINFSFNFQKQSGKIVMELKDVSKSYGDVHIFKKTSAVIKRGDKIALIGANGKGKSTMLRIISGTEPIEGVRDGGFNVNTAFYAQHQLESLDLSNNPLQELVMTGVEKTELELRKILGCFLFTDDDSQKKIKVLSGGEKSRVALAKTLISEANFLLLDEPTNHLDIQSVNMLIQALNQYQGTFLVVSHDRNFIHHVANKIWYIENYEIKEYPGTYEEFNRWYKNRKPVAEAAPVVQEKPIEKKNKESSSSHNNSEERALQNQLRSLTKELESAESDITASEERKKNLETALASPDVYGNPALLEEKTFEFEKLEQHLNDLNKKWEDLATQIESTETSINSI